MDTLGDLIKEVRKKNGLTTTQLAEMVEVSQGYISHLENGRKKNPSPDILARIANVLNISYIDLMIKAGYLTGNNLSELYLKRDELKSRQTEYRNKKKELISKAEEIEIACQKYLTMDELNDKEQYEVGTLAKKRRGFLDQAKELRDMIDDLSIEIDEINDSIRNLLEYKESKQIQNTSESVIDIEDLFNSNIDIVFKERKMDQNDKKKILQLIKITFE